MPYTSPSSKVTVSKSFFCASGGLRTILFLPSITFWVCWHESMPGIRILGHHRQGHFERWHTFYRLAIPLPRNLVHHIGDRPVFATRLHQAHRDLRCVPCRLDHVRLAASHRLVRGCTNHKRFRGYRRKAIDVRAEVQLDDVALFECCRCGGVRAVSG